MIRSTALALAALACCAAISRADIVTVHVYGFDFSTNPANGAIDPVINVGDTIHWVWDNGSHNVRSVIGSPEVFFSGTHSAPFTFDHTFTNPGTWWYYCDLHGSDFGNGIAVGMAGTVTVLPSPGAGAMVGVAALAMSVRRRRTASR